MATPTNSQVNKAGRMLRKGMRGEITWEEFDRALETLIEFRKAHRVALNKATNGLRSMVATAGCKVEVSQRLKRLPTILDKLKREPTLQLATMQDIGGCRAILQNLEEVQKVRRHVSRVHPPLKVSDYIAQPRSSGYRGIHLVVLYDHRKIEVQLRTPVMHEWAITMENLSVKLREDLKSGRGPKEILDLMQLISQAMALEERGEEVDSELVGRISAMRAEAVTYLAGGPK